MISVVMPTYNSAATLPRAIDSVLRQTHADWELIVVDDGSTDETAEILAAVGDPRVTAFHHPKNRGHLAAKNTGLDHIRGDWFTSLNSDDEIEPDALTVMMECAERTGATAITCNATDPDRQEDGNRSGARGLGVGGRDVESSRRLLGPDEDQLAGRSALRRARTERRATVWLPLNRRARRYYLNRDLHIHHPEGADRVSAARRTVRDKVKIYPALAENRVYLETLKATDPREFRRTMLRVWAARLLHPVLGGKKGAPCADGASRLRRSS